MSGGFFRGTSADQDTRFSNKQAKLLKSQKFAPDLDHLVDMTKIKMDVMKPWIAKRVTELLGFEDEVLINFVYGLLEAKEVDGKQIQIQLTGFMEKNTGKFMRELWALLLSAQNNSSGVPQQFLDEKEEEMKKKKVESDRITEEIQRKRDKMSIEEAGQRNSKGMEGEAEIARHVDAARRPATDEPEGERESDRRHDSRRRRHRSPSYHSDVKSPVTHKGVHPTPKLRSRSSSLSRSNSGDGLKSRDRSRSRSPKRSYSRVSPRRNYSPQGPSSRQRSPYSRRRSSPRHHHRSPSPIRRRSPARFRRRSPSPPRRRSSPYNRGSPSPVRRRSPIRSHRRHQSPPSWRKSPIRRRSPVKPRRRSPSPSPYLRRRPQSPQKHSSPSPMRISPKQPKILSRHSPRQHTPDSRSPPRQRKRNHEIDRRRSPSQSRSSLSREHSNPREVFTRGASVSAEEIEYGPEKMDVALSPSPSVEGRSPREKIARGKDQSFSKSPFFDRSESRVKTEKKPRKSTSLDEVSDRDSEAERRLESKRRKREERRLQKEERRRRREERHKRKEERRAQKKLKERESSEGEESEGADGFGVPVTDETENDKKKLEFELRQKALESLRAKKAINH